MTVEGDFHVRGGISTVVRASYAASTQGKPAAARRPSGGDDLAAVHPRQAVRGGAGPGVGHRGRAGSSTPAGIRSTFDLLGEDVLDREAARRSAEANKELLRRIPAGDRAQRLDQAEHDGARHLGGLLPRAERRALLETAREVGGFVRIDMEGSKHTQRTLDLFHRVREKYDNVGIVLQAYLHRTPADVKEAIARGDRVRICKGAYKEPPEVAFQDMDDIRARPTASARTCCSTGGTTRPSPPTTRAWCRTRSSPMRGARKIPAARFEFQMLYGLRSRRWDELVKGGHRVRVYVPYGTHWFPYFYRRLRERRENVFFVLRSLFGG